jgi:hypothetical protein
MLGSTLSSTLPLQCFPISPALFPPLGIISRLSLPHPFPSSLFFVSLHAAPPHLSPLIFIGVVSPRLPFPSIIWTLIPPFLMISTHVLFMEVLLGHGWCQFFPHPPCLVIRVLLFICFTQFLSASAALFCLHVVLPCTVFQPSISQPTTTQQRRSPLAFATTNTETIDFSIGFGFAALCYISL